MPRATDLFYLGGVNQLAISDVTPTALPAGACHNVVLKNHPDNTGLLFFRLNGDGTTLTTANGYPLAVGEESPVLFVRDTSDVILLAEVASEKVCYLPQ